MGRSKPLPVDRDPAAAPRPSRSGSTDTGDPRFRYALGTWVFLRALALVLGIAFVSAWVQIDGLIGSDGLFPAADWLEELRAQGASFADAPSLAWWGASDGDLHALCALGVAAAVALLLGLWPIASLSVAFFAYLSLVNVGGSFFAYQWDTLLLETTLLAIPLAPLGRHARWCDRRSGLGPPSVSRWARYGLYYLNFRLVFVSGVVKLSSEDATWRNLSALRYHYWSQPLPGPLSWPAYQLPDGVHAASCALMLAMELSLPLLLFVPGRPRRLAALGLVLLQVAILLTGNFGFFNLLAIALCLPALDDAWWRRRTRRWPPGRASQNSPSADARWRSLAAASLMLLGSIPLFGTLAGWRRMPASIGNAYLVLAPFHLVGSYGLFARMTTERDELFFEGTRDGETWERYEFVAMPSAADRLPNQIAPHMPRLDWGLWFAALGHPAHEPLVEELIGRLREAQPAVLGLLAHDPFDGQRPRDVRMRSQRRRFSSIGERRAQGVYWVEDLVNER